MFFPERVDITSVYKRQKDFINLGTPVFVTIPYVMETLEQFEQVKKSLMDCYDYILDIQPCLDGQCSRTTPPIQLLVYFKI